MTTRFRWAGLTIAIAFSLGSQRAAAENMTVMMSGGFSAAYAAETKNFEDDTGHHLTTVRGPSMGSSPDSIPHRLARGERTDVVILDANALDTLIADGLVDVHSKVELASSGIGFAVAPSHGPVKIDSVGALRDTLLQSKCIAVSASGSGRYVSEDLLSKLGIADQVHNRLMVSVKTPIAELLADGRCDVGFQQTSELVDARGISFIGPLPASVQKTTVFAAGIPINAAHSATGAALIRFLASPSHDDLLRSVGLDAPRR